MNWCLTSNLTQKFLSWVMPRVSVTFMWTNLLIFRRYNTCDETDAQHCSLVLISPVRTQAIRVLIDAKTDYPSACNAMETLLIHADLLHKRPAEAEAPALTIIKKLQKVRTCANLDTNTAYSSCKYLTGRNYSSWGPSDSCPVEQWHRYLRHRVW